MCGGRVFNVKAAKESCKDKDYKLTYSQLTNYYNELVVQLRLAEYNLNVTIALEVKAEHLSEAIKNEKRIIKLLNESILPALEATVSHYTLCQCHNIHSTCMSLHIAEHLYSRHQLYCYRSIGQ